MGSVNDVKTANEVNTMAARGTQGDGSPYVRTETRPLPRADSAGDAGAEGPGDVHSDNALLAEEPGYGYGV